MTFDNFYEGNSYVYEVGVAKRIADQPGGKYSPLIICGPCGIGKTHLLSAIFHKACASRKDHKIIYISAADFAEELITAILKNEKDSFREKYLAADMLLIDNFELIAAKEQTQEELFEIFDCYSKKNKQIVLCVSGNPSKHNFAEKIKSRLSGGIILNMALPNEETKRAVLDGIAEEWGLELDIETSKYISNKLSTAAEIKGALKNIKTAFETTQQYPLLEDLKKHLTQMQ